MTEYEREEMFTPGTSALMTALTRLREILIAAGFRVQRARKTEATLRVYLDGSRRPILNPRIMKRCVVGGRRIPSPVLTVDIWTDGAALARRQLRAFAPDSACTFVATGVRSGFGVHEGFWIIPLKLSHDGEFSEGTESALAAAARRIWLSLVPSHAP